MILVDTSVWVEHLRKGSARLRAELNLGAVLTHPFVIGELALGSLREWAGVLHALRNLPRANLATDNEVLQLIDRDALFGSGVGYVDAHLIASVRLTPGSRLWTMDRRLNVVGSRMGLT